MLYANDNTADTGKFSGVSTRATHGGRRRNACICLLVSNRVSIACVAPAMLPLLHLQCRQRVALDFADHLQ